MMEVNIPFSISRSRIGRLLRQRPIFLSWEAQYRAMKNEILFMVADMASMTQQRERQYELYRTGIIPQAGFR